MATVLPAKSASKYKELNADFMNRLELERLRGQLMVERATFFTHWEELGRYILPRRTRFFTSDVDKGNKRNFSIINSRGSLAARNCRGGMMSAFTSPSRQWFRLTTMDPDLAKFEPVKEWLYKVTQIEHDVFLRSNLYTSLQTVYGDMEVFATAAMILLEDFTGAIIHTMPFVIGSYYLFADNNLKINGFMRDYRLTVRQIIEEFGLVDGTNEIDWKNISQLVKTLWNNGSTEAWIEITHAIIPNPDWDPNSLRSDKKKYLSIYYERGSSQGSAMATLSETDSVKMLRRKGYDKFRVLAPRWDVSGEDIYGTYCPGMEALGDIQQLQMHERRGSQALEKLVNPPMVGPGTLRTQKATVLPGDITYLDNPTGQKFEPAYQIDPRFDELSKKNMEIESRIKECFYDDLWHIISNLERGNVTAEEVRALKEEKLQDIGPVVDRLNQDLLNPLVEQTFDIMVAQRILPPPPPELAKQGLKIQYTSIMAQAQRALSAASVERFWGFCTSIQNGAPNDPNALDRVNKDELIERYAEELSVPPGIVRDDDELQQVRQAKAQAMEKQQKLAAMEQASKAVKNMAGADTGGQNALTDLMDQGKAGNLLPAA